MKNKKQENWRKTADIANKYGKDGCISPLKEAIDNLLKSEKEQLLEEFEKRIPNVKSINPSYFRDVLEIFKQKLKDEK